MSILKKNFVNLVINRKGRQKKMSCQILFIKVICFHSLIKCAQMWTTAEFALFQKNLFIALVPFIIVIGNIGSILNVIVFSISEKLRSSPCSLYLIFASVGYAVYLNIVALLRLLQLGFNIDPSSKWSWFCKLRYYAIGILLMLPRSYMVLAAIDR